jgi:hypothetical protein
LAPPGVDTTRPSVARVYDFMLGGKDNFAIDRHVAEISLKITPDGPEAAIANRQFLRRVVRFLTAEVGITQFLDIGSGLPTQGNVHEIARAIDPSVRVVYVDNDPMVLAHGRALLADEHHVQVIRADANDPAAILADPVVQELIDFTRPVCLLLMGILHHIPDDDDPKGLAEQFYAVLPAGSYVVLSHFRDPGDEHPEASRKALEVEKIFNATLGTGRWRKQHEILELLGDLEVLDPGLVPLAEWRPDPGDHKPEQTDTYYTFVGVLARKN